MEKRGLSTALKENGVTDKTFLTWADEMRVGLMGQIRKVWAPVGVKVRQSRQMKRQWRYLALAVDGISGHVNWTWIDNMKSTQIAKAVNRWRESGIQAVVWDRARGHKGPEVKSVKMTLIEQPPYAPELNPAERVFEELRSKIEGRTYTSLEDKMAAVEQILEEFSADPDRIKSLAGWQWIKDEIEQLAKSE
jgi:transposase